MVDDAIAAYLHELEAALVRAGRPTQPLVDEAAAHLAEDAARIAAADGCGDAEAARRAVARFGGVDEVIRSVRDNAPLVAARIARVATVVLLISLADAIALEFRAHRLGWPLSLEYLIFSFVAELVGVSVVLWRALAGGRVPGWLVPALIAQGVVALPLVVGEYATTLPMVPTWTHVGVHKVLVLVAPLWLCVTVQSAAGLRALASLRRRRSPLPS